MKTVIVIINGRPLLTDIYLENSAKQRATLRNNRFDWRKCGHCGTVTKENRCESCGAPRMEFLN